MSSITHRRARPQRPRPRRNARPRDVLATGRAELHRHDPRRRRCGVAPRGDPTRQQRRRSQHHHLRSAGLAGGTITLASQLPDLSEDSTTIDGDFDADCDADIGIDGSSAGPGADGSASTSSNHVVRGLAFFDFDGDGLHVQGSNNLVECNYFGTDLAAADGHGNGQFGIRHVAGNDNQIGPYNVVAYNGEFGISVTEFGTYVDPLFTGFTPDDTRVYPLIDFTDGCGRFASADGIVPTDGSGAPFTENFGMRLTGELSLGDTGDDSFEIPQLDDEARLWVDSVERLSGIGPGPLSVTVGLAAGAHTLELYFFEGGGMAYFTLAISVLGSATSRLARRPPAGCGASEPGLCVPSNCGSPPSATPSPRTRSTITLPAGSPSAAAARRCRTIPATPISAPTAR